MSARSYLSIGDVLTLLRQEFPDITISKIRFLESQGLVNPERTPSGYRKFYEHDVERLRWVLRQQREHFLPLKVIKDRFDDGSVGAEGAEGAEETSGRLARTGTRSKYPSRRSRPPRLRPAGREQAIDARVSGADQAGTHQAGTTPVPERTRADSDTTRPGSTSPRQRQIGPAGQDGVARSTAAAGTPTRYWSDKPHRGGHRADLPPRALPPGTRVGAMPGIEDAAEQAPSGLGPVDVGWRRSARRPGQREPAPTRPEPQVRDSIRGGPGSGLDGRRRDPSMAPRRHRSRQQPRRAGDRRRRLRRRRAPEGRSADLTGASLSWPRLAAARGLSRSGPRGAPGVRAARRHPGRSGSEYFDEDALAMANLAAGFARTGSEPRHLRLYKNTADREAGFMEQIVLPLVRQRNPEARASGPARTADELTSWGSGSGARLFRKALRDLLNG